MLVTVRDIEAVVPSVEMLGVLLAFLVLVETEAIDDTANLLGAQRAHETVDGTHLPLCAAFRAEVWAALYPGQILPIS